MLWMKWKMVVDSLRGRRRRLPCFLWFLLLFTVGGLVLFIHQQDLSDIVQQKFPGMMLGNTPQQSGGDGEGNKADNHHTTEAVLSSLVPPMQFPHFESNKHGATQASQELDKDPQRVTKRQRKLLKTSPQSSYTTNNVSTSLTSSSAFTVNLGEITNHLEARRKLVKEICTKYKSSISKTITQHHVNPIFVVDKYKLLYCEVPKVGCSNWKRALLVLSGHAYNTQNIKYEDIHDERYHKRLSSFDQKGIMDRLKTYYKVMFVREPLERMVSAYRDKFENPNNYYHSVFGKAIISKYRYNASLEALKTGDGVTFKEFTQYLLDVHKPEGMDVHWDRANELCHPCLIDYDFIGKFETMNQESVYVLHQIRAPQNLSVPTLKDGNLADMRRSSQVKHKYFSQVTMMELQRIYDFYYMDYLMFNYTKPFKDLY